MNFTQKMIWIFSLATKRWNILYDRSVFVLLCLMATREFITVTYKKSFGLHSLSLNLQWKWLLKILAQPPEVLENKDKLLGQSVIEPQ